LIAAGPDHVCAILATNEIECWGDNSDGQLDHPSGTFTTVSATGSHTCGLRTSGTIECWGRTFPGQPTGTFVSVTAGDEFGCALAANGRVTCWPGAYAGEPDGTFRAISAGPYYACGVRHGGSGTCWPADGEQPDIPDGEYLAVYGGRDRACGVDVANLANCWGRVGNVSFAGGFNGSIAFVSIGEGQFDCAVGYSGSVDCEDLHCMNVLLGCTFYDWMASDGADLPGGPYVSVAAGNEFACGIRSTGQISCAGTSTTGATNPPPDQFRTE
jgi:alpha-tubulin suppressor-like RCC1 family protein